MIRTKIRDQVEIEFDEIKMQEELKMQSDKEYDYKDVIKFMNESSYKIYYVDSKLNTSIEKINDCRYVFINTGVRKNIGKSLVYVSFLYNPSGYFFGGYFGTIEFLLKSCASFLRLSGVEVDRRIAVLRKKIHSEYELYGWNEIQTENNNGMSMEKSNNGTVENIFNSLTIEFNKNIIGENIVENRYHTQRPFIPYSIDNIVDAIYDELLINNWKSKNGLDRYIKIIGSRIRQFIKDNRNEYYIINKLQNVVVNTGLLDKYNNDILVLYKMNTVSGIYRADKLIESKKDLIKEGFTVEQAKMNISPITFFDDDSEMYLKNVQFDDFDISQKSLRHILEERRDRFPEDVATLSDDVLANKIDINLQIGIKMLQRDMTYARPSYSGKLEKICWLMPLYINRSFSEEPELVMVISKEEYYYEVKTIYAYDDTIKDRITAMELYRIGW